MCVCVLAYAGQQQFNMRNEYQTKVKRVWNNNQMKFIQITKPEDAIEIGKKEQNEWKIAGEWKLPQQQTRCKNMRLFSFSPFSLCVWVFTFIEQRERERKHKFHRAGFDCKYSEYIFIVFSAWLDRFRFRFVFTLSVYLFGFFVSLHFVCKQKKIMQTKYLHRKNVLEKHSCSTYVE